MGSAKWVVLIAAGFLGAGGMALWTENHTPSQVEQSSKQLPEQNKRPLDPSIVTSKSKENVKEETQVLMNDPAIKQAWGLKKSEAFKAWEISKGSKDIVVAVIDTGIDVDHEALKENLWKNPGETGFDKDGKNKAKNGLDDDGNGFIDDVNGWNFVSNASQLTDNHGHGTHIAGLIGARAVNGKGLVGIAPNVSLMVLKYFDPKVPNTDNLKNTINAIRYAIQMKAQIINYSGGGTEFSAEEKAAVEEARRAGVLFVAAAGNEKSNSDKHKYFPADYDLDNIISVTAIDPSTEVLASSNYGVETVDLAAPGQNILSTLPGNSYGYMTGTSQATAFVSGAAVLFMALRKNVNPDDVKKYILATGDSNMSLMAKTNTSRQLNLFKALTMLESSIGVSGAIAANVADQSFTANPVVSADPSRQISHFGKSLMESLEQNQIRKKN
jgi:thermitase